ncbi:MULTISPECIES: hypothetical protein [Variovorax]|jgi:hypothetical protein|nr:MULTISPECIES: hypothetical protein [Variovorax]MBN8755494.1 hypothetical protein [Variovorax sp.]UKI09344.1 hypothetical protein L3V85_05635 [Variovorax paradoxus]
MAAKFILAALAVALFAAALLRPGPAARTWLLTAAIFTAVAAWLQWHTS